MDGPIDEPLDSLPSLTRWVNQRVQRQYSLNVLAADGTGPPDVEMSADMVRAGLCRMKERGEFRAEAPIELLVATLLAAHEGGALVARVTGEVAPLADALAGALDFIAGWAT